MQVDDAFKGRESIVLTLCGLTKVVDYVAHDLLYDKRLCYSLWGTPLPGNMEVGPHGTGVGTFGNTEDTPVPDYSLPPFMHVALVKKKHGY